GERPAPRGHAHPVRAPPPFEQRARGRPEERCRRRTRGSSVTSPPRPWLASSPAATPRRTGAPRARGAADAARPGAAGPSAVRARNAHGEALTVNVDGGPVVDPAGPFSQALGTNGRSCATCHVPEAAMSLTPAVVRRAFDETNGTAPLFRTNDGSSSPLADVSTAAA